MLIFKNITQQKSQLYLIQVNLETKWVKRRAKLVR